MIPQLFNAQMAQYATPTTTGESSVVVENGIKCYLPELKIDGNTTQEQSKNLFNAKDTEFVPNNQAACVCSKDGDNTFIFTSKTGLSANNHPYASTSAILNFNLKPNTTYTSKVIITITPVVEDDYTLVNANLMVASLLYQKGETYDSSGVGKFKLVDGIKINGTLGEKTVITTFTTPSDLSVFTHVATRISRHTEITFKDLMIVEGTYTAETFPEYESYKPLSPDYPQDIKNAGDDGVEIEIRGKNLLNPDVSLTTVKGVVAQTNAYRGVNISQYLGRDMTLNIRLKENKTVPEGVYFGIGHTGNITATSISADWLILKGEIKDTSATITAKTTVADCAIIVYDSKEANWNAMFDAFDIMFEIDTLIPSEYEPYVELQTITIPSSVTKDNGEVVDLRFAKVDDTADYLLIDSITKSVKYVQNIGFYEFDGNEKIIRSSVVLDNVYRHYIESVHLDGDYKYNYDDGYCTHLTRLSTTTDKEGFAIGINNAFLYFFLNKTDFPHFSFHFPTLFLINFLLLSYLIF